MVPITALSTLLILIQELEGDNQVIGLAPTAFCDTVTEILISECNALVMFYNSTGGPNWIENSSQDLAIVVDAAGLSTDQTEFWAFGLMDSSLTFEAEIDGYYYQMGASASRTATLKNEGSGLAGATISAKIARSDAVVDTIALSDQGDGTYAADYIIPNTPGYLDITIAAVGNDSGTDFTRQSNLLAMVTPDDAQFSGAYNDQGNDSNADGLFEKLDFNAEVNVSTAGDYIVSALLLAEDGSLITNIAAEVSLSTGTHSVTLSFDGDDIRFSETDGPYNVTNLRITAINAGIPSQIVEQAWVTKAYQWQDFGTDATQYVYLPVIVR